MYKIIKSINGNHYIGITESSLEKRWIGHLHDSLAPQYPLHRTILRYGKEHFNIKQILAAGVSTSVISGN